MFVCVFFVALSFAQTTAPTYLITSSYGTGSACSAGPFVRRSIQTTCTPGGTSTCVANQNTQCVSGVPVLFSGSVSLATYSNNQCTGNPSEQLSWANNLCVQFGPDSYTAFCSGGTMYLVYFTQTNICLGGGYYFTFSGNQCVPLSSFLLPFNYTGTFGFASCAPVCFHESTEIDYNGVKMTMDSLQSGHHKGVCTIPHTVQADGVVIQTSCSKKPLRLTNDHIVFTSVGKKAANAVVKGDVLFKNIHETEPCTVTAVSGEHNQRYFGLNCKDSEVLANGIKTSTFGITHDLPATYMKYATKIMSVEHASKIGEGLVQLLTKMGAF